MNNQRRVREELLPKVQEVTVCWKIEKHNIAEWWNSLSPWSHKGSYVQSNSASHLQFVAPFVLGAAVGSLPSPMHVLSQACIITHKSHAHSSIPSNPELVNLKQLAYIPISATDVSDLVGQGRLIWIHGLRQTFGRDRTKFHVWHSNYHIYEYILDATSSSVQASLEKLVAFMSTTTSWL